MPRYVVCVIEGIPIDPSRLPTRGGGVHNQQPMPLEASVLDSYNCYRQVSVYTSGVGGRLTSGRLLQVSLAEAECARRNADEEAWELC